MDKSPLPFSLASAFSLRGYVSAESSRLLGVFWKAFCLPYSVHFRRVSESAGHLVNKGHSHFTQPLTSFPRIEVPFCINKLEDWTAEALEDILKLSKDLAHIWLRERELTRDLQRKVLCQGIYLSKEELISPVTLC
jgi:hypothetical protein